MAIIRRFQRFDAGSILATRFRKEIKWNNHLDLRFLMRLMEKKL
jgi:hypothetical protein